jgi:hypothetical protein
VVVRAANLDDAALLGAAAHARVPGGADAHALAARLPAAAGAQLWVEQDDDPARVRCLVWRAAEAGLGLVRVS